MPYIPEIQIGNTVYKIKDLETTNLRNAFSVPDDAGILELYLNEVAVQDGVDQGLVFSVNKNVNGYYYVEFSNAAGNNYTARTRMKSGEPNFPMAIYKYSDFSKFYGYVVVNWKAYSDGTVYPRKTINKSAATNLLANPIIAESINSFVYNTPGIIGLYLNEQAIAAGVHEGMLITVENNNSGLYSIDFANANGDTYIAQSFRIPKKTSCPIPIYNYGNRTVFYGYAVVDWDAFGTGITYPRTPIGKKATNISSSPNILEGMKDYVFGCSEIKELYLNSTAISNNVDMVHTLYKNVNGTYRVMFSNGAASDIKAWSAEITQDIYQPIPIYSVYDSTLLYGYIIVNWEKLANGENRLCGYINKSVSSHIDLCPLIKASVEGASDSRVDSLEQRVDSLEDEIEEIDTQAILEVVSETAVEIISQQYAQDSVVFEDKPVRGHTAPFAVSSDGIWKALNQRRVIVCGDSYLMDYTFSWGNKLQEMLGLSNTDFYKGGLSGGGFICLPNGTVGNGFLLGMQQIASTVTSPDTITDIIVCGGLNDSFFSEAEFPGETFTNNVANFIGHCKTNYPNAKIWIGYCGNAIDISNSYIGTRTIENRLYAIKKYADIVSDVPIAINSELWKVFTYSPEWFNATDKLHPVEESSIAIARAIMAWITGSPMVFDKSNYTIIRSGTGSVLSNTSTHPFEAHIKNGELIIKLNPWYSQSPYRGDFLGTTQSDIVSGSEIQIGTTSSGPIFNKNFETTVTLCYGHLLGSQKYIPASLKFGVGNGWYLFPFANETIPSGTNLFMVGSNDIIIPAEYYV